ncbi:MAG TPA: tRNA (adenosine(37)-N6)-threonylcarbamoyltransferase complex dimerization subunit type 1 TsaB, partial [Candidatus Dormibacteraeota bacterium]|nr:tRNA (adenosine(37)-N6)-threonylcarbamoyltransferase complex dimerization subunit type 1 TsaB [Candidatus Dormibacteraeota bacterium]
MILVIDTSSTIASIATIDEAGWSEEFIPSRDPQLIAYLRLTAQLNKITKVAVATGPGSFTGLRKGVSFGLGLAIGLRIPIVPLPTL